MRTTEECIQLQPVVREPSNITGWEKLINKEVVKGTLKGRTCKIYSAKLSSTVDRDARCVCGRLARRHSYTGDPKTEYQGSQKWKLEFAAEVDVTIYGQLANGARVCDCFRTVSDIVICIFLSSSFDVIHKTPSMRWKHSFSSSLMIWLEPLSYSLVALVGQKASLWQTVWKESLWVVLGNWQLQKVNFNLF